MRSRYGFIIILILFPLLFVSCDKNVVVDMYQHIDNSIWTWDDVRRYAFEIDDTITEHDILIQLRHTCDYPMSNLYIFVEVTNIVYLIIYHFVGFK